MIRASVKVLCVTIEILRVCAAVRAFIAAGHAARLSSGAFGASAASAWGCGIYTYSAGGLGCCSIETKQLTFQKTTVDLEQKDGCLF